MRRRDEQLRDEVLVVRRRAGDAAPAAPLRPVARHRVALDVAAVGDGDDHVLVGDQLLDGDLALVVDDLGAALVGELRLDLLELRLDDRHEHGVAAEDLLEALDERPSCLISVDELLALEAGELASRMSRIACACRADRSKVSCRPALAVSVSFDARMISMTASMLSTAITRPSTICAARAPRAARTASGA